MYGMNGWNKEIPGGDLISRAAAIDAVRTYYDDEYALADSIEELIEKLPSAQPEQRWIPCSERLPEHGGWYITTYRLTKDNNKVGLLWYSTAHGWEWNNAIAWMPLPEPYREVSE